MVNLLPKVLLLCRPRPFYCPYQSNLTEQHHYTGAEMMMMIGEGGLVCSPPEPPWSVAVVSSSTLFYRLLWTTNLPTTRWLSHWRRGPKSALWRGQKKLRFIFTQQYFRVAAETAKLSSVLTLTQVEKIPKQVRTLMNFGFRLKEFTQQWILTR